MDITNYIQSGILESFALGLTTDQETREVECLSSIYPELRQHLIELDKDLIQITAKNAMKPSPKVKEELFKRLDKEFTIALNPTKTSTTKTEEKDSGIIKRLAPVWAAASAILLGLTAWMFVQNGQLTETVNEQVASNKQYEERIGELETDYAYNNTKNAFITNQNTKLIDLKDPATSEELQARVYWKAEDNKFLIASNLLPQAPEGKQYQFWAIVEGVPQDMGVIPVEQGAELFADISFEKVDAFAITLEDFGGKPTPNLDQLKAIGNV